MSKTVTVGISDLNVVKALGNRRIACRRKHLRAPRDLRLDPRPLRPHDFVRDDSHHAANFNSHILMIPESDSLEKIMTSLGIEI